MKKIHIKIVTYWFWIAFASLLLASIILTEQPFQAYRLLGIIILSLLWNQLLHAIPILLLNALGKPYTLSSSLKLSSLIVFACIFNTIVCIFLFSPSMKTGLLTIVDSIICSLGLFLFVVYIFATVIKKIKSNREKLTIKNEELSEAIRNIKELTGLLPICAACKKIRDDKGFWNNIESYLELHSKAVFSKSLCPACKSQ